jgi:predicted nucleotide-binding protein
MSRDSFGNVSSKGDGNTIQGGIGNQQTFNAARPQERAEPSGEPSLLEKAARAQAELDRSVFVVYGRDGEANSAVFQLLVRLNLRPLEWETLVRGHGGGMMPPLSQIVINAPHQASAAVVVLTPDDMVMLHPELRKPHEDPFETHPALQPRPNVLLELGIALGVYPERTLILQFGDLRPIADINGLNTVRFHQSIPLIDALRKIAGRLEEAGLPIDDSGSDWLDPKPFHNLRAYRRRPN